MDSPSQADLAKLLAEALDDFDADPAPVPPAAPEVTAPAAPETPEAAAELPVAPPPPMPLAATPAAPASTRPFVDVQSDADAQADELAKMLLSSLNVGGAGGSGGMANGISGAAPADEDEMEKTLRNLAASAEALADGPAGGGSSTEEEAMLKLLQQLGAGMGDLGAGAKADGADDGMMDLLQKLSAAVPPPEAASGGGGGGSSTAKNGGSSSSSGGGGSSASEQAAGDDTAMEGLLDQLVGQLLSKDVMLEPIKHLHAEFPKYLASHASSISAEELQRYQKQQALVERILEAYEETPADTDKVATLMQQMQACGAPPAEIAGPVADSAGCVVM